MRVEGLDFLQKESGRLPLKGTMGVLEGLGCRVQRVFACQGLDGESIVLRRADREGYLTLWSL